MTDYRIGLVGESHYQAAIGKIGKGDAVQFVAEPSNPHDPRALRATCAGATIGYVPRGSWLTRAVLDEGKIAVASVAEVLGGRGDAPSLGVVLDVVLVTADRTARPDKPAMPAMASNILAGIGGLAIAAVVLIIIVGYAGSTDSARDQATGTSTGYAALPAATVQGCSDTIRKLGRSGLLRGHDVAGQIEVDEAQWAALPRKEKTATLLTASCADWGSYFPPAGRSVVARGWRSGEILRTLTENGVF